ncbi:Rpn family recombination-promoting nuclease/putative transposase [Sodalis sp. dw_96]|uniref:Rpn family recombination-promoting nuclease/putative transposase n=1 Tax=Sodalis sp. dw_96 TaxID=2719794 RepID=UPI001BD1D197|nr:Rpn family recombination-promoting nuclease/putative transposase [Sodalis sp. dw_96]
MTTNILRHDAIFKMHMADPSIARDFFKKHVPEALRQHCDFNTLELCSGSFVETNLRQHYSDMLYSVRTKWGEGYIYCLVEHQSRSDKLMAFRLLRYSLSAMQQHLNKGHTELPVVVPLLFYHGSQSPYPYTNNWLDCFENPELAGMVYGNPFPLVDITVTPDKEIMTHSGVAALELVQKHIRLKDMIELADSLGTILSHQPLPSELFKSLMIYIGESGNSPDATLFIDRLQRLAPRYQEDIMTIAQQLADKGRLEGIQEGIKEGIQEGIKEGVQKGELEGKRKVASQLFVRGFDKELIKSVTALSDEQLSSLAY